MMSLRAVLARMALVLIAASAIRFHDLDRQSLWFDEGWSAYAASQPTLLDAARADLTNPPLYYMLLNVGASFFGTSEYALRWVSAALNLITLALLYVLARALFDKRAGVYAATLAACSALLWWASQEARMYTLLALLVTLSALAWHRLLTRPTRAAWMVLWAAELALLYSHNTGPIAVIWLNAAMLLAWVIQRSLRRPNWRLWLVGQIVVFLLWLPWLDLFLNIGAANSALASGPNLTLTFLFEVWQGILVGNWAMVGAPASGALITGLVLLPVALLVVPWSKPHARWLILHTLLLIGGIITGLIILGNEYHGRYAVLTMPLLIAALGAGIARLRLSLVRVGILMLFVGAFLLIREVSRQPIYGNDDVRGMVQHYAETLAEDESVLAWSYADRYDLWYYWDRLGVRAQRVTLPEGAEADTIIPLLPDTDAGVSINVWYTQRADYRGMLPCLIGHLTSRAPYEFTTYGMTDLYFEARSPELPIRVSASIPFTHDGTLVARLTQLGSLPPTRADQALCIPVQLIAEQPLASETSVAVIARNALGWEIARSDAVVATADQRTALAAGEFASAYPLLRLPYGAPPGEYMVYLRLYDAQGMPSGYTPADPDLATSGRDVRLGTWRVRQSDDWSATGLAPAQGNFEQFVSEDLRLVNVTIDSPPSVRNGDSLHVSLLWQGEDDTPDLTLRDADGRWEVVIPSQEARIDGALLDWRLVRLPNDAPEGEAVLSLPNGVELARLSIANIPVMSEPPASAVSVNRRFPGVGTLMGYTMEGNSLTLESPPEITLIWRAEESAIPVSYTVFVQLLDRDGRVIAQSDSIPAHGERPTTGWREGEYIIDRHSLTYNELAQPGMTQLIVGWYDANTNRRLQLEDGTDALLHGQFEITSNSARP